MPKGREGLRELLKDVYAYSSKASEINRQLVFAGIAIIWIYKNPSPSPTIISSELVLPLLLWIASLGLDLLNYLFGAIAYSIFYEIKERDYKNGKLDNEDIPNPYWMTRTSDILFILKVAANVWAYIELGKFLFPKLPPF